MALYKNEKNNSIVFNQDDFDINRNYIPDWVLAIGSMQKDKPIDIAIDMEETPILFILYLMKVKEETPAVIRIYYRDKSEALKIALKGYNLSYRNIKKFPYKLPETTETSARK